MGIYRPHLQEMMELHRKIKIPLQHSVSLICKVEGIGMTHIAEQCGHNRSYLNQSLRGVFKPSKDFRDGIANRLGIDPWLYAPDQ